MILLDTDVCLLLLSGNRKLLDAGLLLEDAVAISPTTLRELFFAAAISAEPKKNRALIDRFLVTVQLLSDTSESARIAAETEARAQKRGSMYSLADITQYAIAKAYGARLITTNGKRYSFT